MAVTRKKALTGVGRYDFVNVIGKGGMGTVYRATDRDSGAAVAVKVLALDFSENPDLLARFAKEFRSAAKLEHPNIVRAIEFGSDGPHTFLATEFVEGIDLGHMIQQRGRIPEDEAVRVITQSAQALHYAHSFRIIHRDVKPDNILVRSDGVAKLADFGLAKDFDDEIELTLPSHGLGTPHFMPPEQYRDAKNVGVAGDVYSLGATLYNAVTGRLPFDGCASLFDLAKKVTGDIPGPRELVPELSERVDFAIRRAMNPDPTKRPSTCLEFFKLLSIPKSNRRSRAKKPEKLAAKPKDAADRRTWVRHPMSMGTTCTIDTGVHGGGAENQDVWPLVVRDVSAGGAGFLLARRFEPGTELTITFAGSPDGRPKEFTVKVVRVQADGLGHWAHGCAFAAPLSEGELAMLLGELAAVVTPAPARA
jgi:serine/threonine protein kinase